MHRRSTWCNLILVVARVHGPKSPIASRLAPPPFSEAFCEAQKMSTNPFLQLYPGDYFAKTRHFNNCQHGAYLLMIMTAWMRKDGALPDDDEFLAKITCLTIRKWKAIKPSVMEFWFAENGYLFNERIIEDRKKLAVKTKSLSDSGKKGAEARKAKSLKLNEVNGSPASFSDKPPLSILEPEPELDSKKEKIPKRKCQIPDGFPDEKSLVWAGSHFTEAEKPHLHDGIYDLYRDQAGAHSWRYADWHAAFRNFCKNQVKWDKGQTSPAKSEQTSPYNFGQDD